MERIQIALEKAQKQRDNALDSGVKKEDSQFERKHQNADISYTKTKTVTVSNETLKKNRVVAGLKDDPTADTFKILRTKILLEMRANKWNVLAVTSPSSGAGKSLTAVNLAISIAMEANHSVLLADLDFRRPSLHQYFGMTFDKGLWNYFFEDASISELLVNPGIESLVLLPSGQPVKRSSELLSSPKMLTLTEELKHRYENRIVLVDLPPLLHSDDALVFLPNVDACLLVLAEGESTEEEIKQSMQLIGRQKFLGSVLNKSATSTTTSY